MNKIEILDKIEKVVYVTQPSPVILVSTISKDNVENVAPFAMFMNCSTKPDNMVAIAISPKTDTYANIKETKQFIIGIPKENMLDKLYKFARQYENMSPQEQLIYLTEAEKIFKAFDKVPDSLWEEEYDKYKTVVSKYKDIKMVRWVEENK